MAVVFFNSRADYEKAALSEQAVLLHEVEPYVGPNRLKFGRPFSIFLIDGDNNVIDNSSLVELPRLAGNGR